MNNLKIYCNSCHDFHPAEILETTITDNRISSEIVCLNCLTVTVVTYSCTSSIRKHPRPLPESIQKTVHKGPYYDLKEIDRPPSNDEQPEHVTEMVH